jgi:hypothetical protein
MDPITAVIVAALGKISEQAIHDAYNALKSIIAKKFGADGKLLRSVKDLEDDPDSEAGKMMIKEQAGKANVLNDPDVMNALQTLQSLLEKSLGKPIESTTIIQQAGDNAQQFRQIGGNVVIKK